MTFEIYCDGSCGPSNPGPAAWGSVIVHQDGTRTEHNGFIQVDGTNNIAELTAAIESLRLTPRGAQVLLATDSQYVVNGVTIWVAGWEQKGWLTADKKPVKNKELWIQLMAEVRVRSVTMQWVRGHNGHPENERADALANAGLQLNK